MADRGREITDELLEEMERKVRKEYQQAVKELQEKLDDYLRRFQVKDEIWRKNVAEGKKTQEEYQKWRMGQIAVGQRWEKMRDELARDLHNANAIARSIVEGYRPEVYANSHDYATYEVESGAGIDTSYTLYNREAVERIMRENPELLPPPGSQMEQTFREWDEFRRTGQVSDKNREAFEKLAAENKDIRWQEGKLQSVITQSILQGESIPNMSKRIAREMGEINHKSTIRYARTAITGAENAGKVDAYRRAEDMGVELDQQWRAVVDMRTRHEHRQLDGQTRHVGEPFEVDGYKLMFPGDPSAPGHLIWNCRCHLRGVVKGLEPRAIKYRSMEDIEGMSYDEWRESKVEKPHRITKQEEIAETMRRRYIREDYGGGRGPGGSGKQKPL